MMEIESARRSQGSNRALRSSQVMETEIVHQKPYGKRKYGASTPFPQDIFRTPIKKLRISDSPNRVYHLSNAEKAYIYLHDFIGSDPHKIADSIDRDKRSVKAFLKDRDSPEVFSPKHSRKGRWRKNSGKLNEMHKYYLRKWMNDGSLKSARNAYFRLNSIKKLTPVSYNPIRLFLKDMGDFVKPTFKSELSEVNREKRVKYCLKYRNFNFRKVLFTDESMFQLNSNNQKVFKRKGDKPPQKTKLNPNSKIMVWGGISYSGKTELHIVNGKLKADGYVKILKQRRRDMISLFMARKIWYFQQDGAPCHRPLLVKRYIKRWLTPKLLPHPPQSPDLNPIELIWAQMKILVERKTPRTKSELLEAILESWRQIDLGKIRACIDNLQKKIDKIIELNGDLL